ncbi:acyl-CoA N-acyltransferase [Neolentinus lepideus HHB14362 ss-1]|uniref:Acyl-CoA N-acyltransferase n=1 Tax=Neolentinus lepideus HHB14362 ss-1 TaxID=1314782 RepID=A0A165SYZ7_9AGAM|nr:acyl-CoA N-acyltransferase [Neolentinus lepideus HHB14362 ss-1]
MSNITIRPAQSEDVPRMAEIFGAAFTDDRHTQVKTVETGMGDQVKGMGDALSHWMTVPERCKVMKAVDESTHEIVGWVVWGLRGYPQPEIKEPNESTEKKTEEAKTETNPEEPKLEPSKKSLERLKELTHADLERWMDIFMPPGTKCMFIVAISVHPAYQGRGIGSALIRWGTSKADEDGVFCWVHASEAGRPAFEKAEFEQQGTLVVDLDEYAPRPRENGLKWGRYTFTYMKRLPHAKT